MEAEGRQHNFGNDTLTPSSTCGTVYRSYVISSEFKSDTKQVSLTPKIMPQKEDDAEHFLPKWITIQFTKDRAAWTR